MGLLKKLILAKGTLDFATNLTDRKLKKIGRRNKMFNNKYKNKPNIISRIAKAAFVVGAGPVDFSLICKVCFKLGLQHLLVQLFLKYSVLLLACLKS